MLQSTRGILLHTFSYSDSSVIAKIYTLNFGLQSFILKGVKSPKSKIKTSALQVLTLLDLVIYHKQKEGLQSLKELKAEPILFHLQNEIAKTSISFFLAEIILKSLEEGDPNPAMFYFLENCILTLNEQQNSCSNFHLVFALQLSKHLGFAPLGAYQAKAPYFNLMEGNYQPGMPIHSNCLNQTESELWSNISHCALQQSHLLSIGRSQRQLMLEKIICYYQLHLPNWGSVRTLDILENIFN